MLGARAATADVLIFLDSHVEVCAQLCWGDSVCVIGICAAGELTLRLQAPR